MQTIQKPMTEYTIGDKTYLVGEYEQAFNACGELIYKMLWTFKAELIVRHVFASELYKSDCIDCIEVMQDKLKEKCNDVIGLMLSASFDEFVATITYLQGMSSFLSIDNTQLFSSNIEGLPMGLLAFRVK